MKEYVFYTYEGRTESPTGQEVENLQILGFDCGKNEQEAKNRFLNENKWIIESGFDKCKIKSKQVF